MSGYGEAVPDKVWLNRELARLRAETGEVNRRALGASKWASRIRYGTIDEYYTSGRARILFDGEVALSDPATSMWDYQPTPRARVAAIRDETGGYMIIGPYREGRDYAWFHSAPSWYQNGWRDYDASYFPLNVSRTTTGFTKLMGLLAAGSMVAGSTIAILPETFRPDKMVIFPLPTNAGMARVAIYPDGRITAFGALGANGWISLDHCFWISGRTPVWVDGTLGAGYTATDVAAQGLPGTHNLGNGLVLGRGAVNVAAPANGGNLMQQPYIQSRGQHLTSVADGGMAGLSIGWNNTVITPNSSWVNDKRPLPAGGTSRLQLNPLVAFDEASGLLPFTPASLTNGWANVDSTRFHSAGYAKTSDGIVVLRGLVNAGAVGVIFNLPPGYRPRRRILRMNISNDAQGRVDVAPDGNVIFSTGSNAWFSLDGIVFLAEQ